MLNTGLDFSLFLVTIVANATLAVVVWLYGNKNVSKHLFITFVGTQILWAITNYTSFFVEEKYLLLTIRLVMFFAVWYCFFFFIFIRAYLYQNTQPFLKKENFIFFFLITLIVAILALSPFVFSSLNGSNIALPGPGMPIFGLFVFGNLLSGLFLLLKKYIGTSREEKQQVQYLLTGFSLTLISILAFVFIGYVLFRNVNFVRFSHIYTLPFVAFTAYAMVRHNLFNVKVIVAEISILLIAAILILNLLNSKGIDAIIFNLLVLLVFLGMGIFLIRGVQQEVEQRQKIEQIAKDLASANEHLRELDKEKSEFVSIASHQLRTPLTAISGYASMLLEGSYGKLSKKAEESVNRIYQSSGRLALIIEDFLDITKIEQGKMSYQFTTVDMKELLQEVTGEMKPHAYEKNLELSLEIEDQGSFNATADLGKIRQVISNLIDNAIKYSPTGKITVTLSRDSVRGKICVSVHDNGIGISPQSMEKLFQKFSRAEGVKKIYTEGSGLGLYVAQEMVKAHHGRIWAESEGEGKGSTFSIELMAED